MAKKYLIMGYLAQTFNRSENVAHIRHNGSGIAAVWEIEVRQHKFITKTK